MGTYCTLAILPGSPPEGNLPSSSVLSSSSALPPTAAATARRPPHRHRRRPSPEGSAILAQILDPRRWLRKDPFYRFPRPKPSSFLGIFFLPIPFLLPGDDAHGLALGPKLYALNRASGQIYLNLSKSLMPKPSP